MAFAKLPDLIGRCGVAGLRVIGARGFEIRERPALVAEAVLRNRAFLVTVGIVGGSLDVDLQIVERLLVHL